MAKKKGILDQAIDALTTRDEVQAADEAKKEAEAARTDAAREAAARRAAEAKAAAAEAKAAQAEAEAAKKAAAEAKKQTEAAGYREKFRAELQHQAAEREAREAQARLYVVKAGDSLSKIAKEVLGDARRWPEIFEANKDQIKDPNLIRVGQELKIPPK